MTPTAFQQLCDEQEWHYHHMPPSDYHRHGWQEVKLIEAARQHGHQALFNAYYFREFKIPFFKDFPVATLAKEQHQTKTHMNLTLNITADPAILEVLNRIADGLGTRCPAPVVTEAPIVPVEKEEEEAAPAPKKKKKALEVKVPEPEPEEEEAVITGPELAVKFKPLSGTPYATQLREYKDGPLGLEGTKLSEVTDPVKLKKLDAKLTALLEEQKNEEV